MTISYLEVIHRPIASNYFFKELETITGVDLTKVASSIQELIEKTASPKITLYPGKKMDKTLDLLFGQSWNSMQKASRMGTGVSLGRDLLDPKNARILSELEALHPGVTGRIKKLGGVVFVPSAAAINEAGYKALRSTGMNDTGARVGQKVNDFFSGGGKALNKQISAHELTHHNRRVSDPSIRAYSPNDPGIKRVLSAIKEEAIAYGTGAANTPGVLPKINAVANLPLGLAKSVAHQRPVMQITGEFNRTYPQAAERLSSITSSAKSAIKNFFKKPKVEQAMQQEAAFKAGKLKGVAGNPDVAKTLLDLKEKQRRQMILNQTDRDLYEKVIKRPTTFGSRPKAKAIAKPRTPPRS